MDRVVSDESPSPLPPDFACTACGYDLSSSPVWRCAECGRAVWPEDLAVHARWREAERTWRGKAYRTFGGLALGALLTTLAAAIASGEWEGVPLLFAVCLAVVLGHGAVGSGLIVWLARPRERAAWRRAFYAAGWWVHGPWLCIPGCALILLGIGLLALAGNREEAVMGGALLGFFAWIFWSIFCLAWTLHKLDQHASRWSVSERRGVLGALGVLSVLTMVPTGLLGLVAGAAVASGLDRWL